MDMYQRRLGGLRRIASLAPERRGVEKEATMFRPGIPRKGPTCVSYPEDMRTIKNMIESIEAAKRPTLRARRAAEALLGAKGCRG